MASNLESNPGWGIQSQTKDWSNEICLLWVPLLFSCLKSYSSVHQLITSCPPFHFFTLFVTSIFGVTLHCTLLPLFFPFFSLLCLFHLSLNSWPFCSLYFFYLRLVLDSTFLVWKIEVKESFELFHCNSLCVVKGI